MSVTRLEWMAEDAQRLAGRRFPLQQQLNGLRIWHPAAHNPTAVTELLGSQDGRWMVVTTVRQTLRVLSHPFKAGYGHGGWVKRGAPGA